MTIDLTKFKQLQERTGSRHPNMIEFKKRAAQKYRSFLFTRFDRFSRGGGNWPATRRSDTRKRRRGRPIKGVDGRKRNAFILRDTHTLMKSLSPVFRNLPGQYQRLVGKSIEVGIRGGKHPKAKITVGELAEIHQLGLGVRVRKIVVQPDAATRSLLVADLKKTIKSYVRR